MPLAVKEDAAVTDAAKLDAALTVRVSVAVVPRIELPRAEKLPLLLTVIAAFAVMGAVEAKEVAAFTVRLLLPPAVPKTTSPRALNKLPFATVTAAFAVTAAFVVIVAPDTKVVAALTVSAWVDEAPRTVLPAAVRVEVELVRVTPAEKLARPALSMVSRSTGCPLLLLVLPAVVVLKTSLPPVLPVASCM